MSVHLDHDWFPRPLPSNVVIGPRTWCYSSFAFLHYQSRQPCGVRIGHDTGIYNGTFFDLGPQGEVTIGNYCTLVGAIIASNGRVDIGDYAFLAHEVVLADDAVTIPFVLDASPTASPEKSIVIGPNSWVVPALFFSPVPPSAKGPSSAQAPSSPEAFRLLRW